MADRDLAHVLEAGARLVGEAGAAMVKLEGAGPHILEAIAALTARAIPVCAHLGLTPQSVHKFGGFRIQGREDAAAEHLLAQAQAVQAAGASLLVLEGVPSALGQRLTAASAIPVIGIGAGPHCDGQVLVIHDMLGITPGRRPKFSKDFLAGHDSVGAALAAYAADVRSGAFPAPEHCFNARTAISSCRPSRTPPHCAPPSAAGGARARPWVSCRPWATCMPGISRC
jgi:3-methyl-2-oxobutanoate hydroxymethyltransferase